jgi:hypothetical protein
MTTPGQALEGARGTHDDGGAHVTYCHGAASGKLMVAKTGFGLHREAHRSVAHMPNIVD